MTSSDSTQRWMQQGKFFLISSPPFCPVLFTFFRLFCKKSKQAVLFHDFLHEKCIDGKNGVHHDEEHGKTKKMAVSDFSVDCQKVV